MFFVCDLCVDPITEDGIISSSLTQTCQSLRRLERKLYLTFFILFSIFQSYDSPPLPFRGFRSVILQVSLSLFLIFTKVEV